MTDTYGMRQELALEISSTFWKTTLGTQAPAVGGQEEKEKPAKKPSEKQPRAQRIKGLLKLFGKMSGFAWLMFVVGAYGVIACTIWLVQAMITEEHADAMGILYLMVGIYLLDLTLKVFWMPLSVVETSDILSRVFPGGRWRFWNSFTIIAWNSYFLALVKYSSIFGLCARLMDCVAHLR